MSDGEGEANGELKKEFCSVCGLKISFHFFDDAYIARRKSLECGQFRLVLFFYLLFFVCLFPLPSLRSKMAALGDIVFGGQATFDDDDSGTALTHFLYKEERRERVRERYRVVI